MLESCVQNSPKLDVQNRSCFETLENPHIVRVPMFRFPTEVDVLSGAIAKEVDVLKVEELYQTFKQKAANLLISEDVVGFYFK